MKKKLPWILVLAAGILITVYGFRLGSASFSDFSGYYTSSKILITGNSASQIYNDELFLKKMHSFGMPDSTIVMYVNPPPAALVMIPVAWMNPHAAKTVWNVFNILFIAAAFFLFFKFNKISFDSASAPAVAALFICSLPYMRNLQRGQVYILLLILVMFFFHGYQQGNSLLSSLSLSLLFWLKYFGWIFFILFIIEKRWKELGLTLLFIAAGFLFTSITLGFESYRENFRELLAAMNRKDFSLTGLPCIPAFFGSLFTFDPQWNHHPPINISWLTPALTAVSLLILILISFLKTGRNTKERFSAVLILSVLFTPLAADHHYMLLILPAAFLIQTIPELKYPKMIIAVVILYFLLGWYPELKMQNLSGWLKLFAFPRLYAAVLIWSLLLFSFRQNRIIK